MNSNVCFYFQIHKKVSYLHSFNELELQYWTNQRKCLWQNLVSLNVTKAGNINVVLRVNNKYVIAQIINLRHNLLSVQKLVKASLNVVFDGGKIIVKKNSKQLLVWRELNNLYEVEFNVEVEKEAHLCSTDNAQIWHKD